MRNPHLVSQLPKFHQRNLEQVRLAPDNVHRCILIQVAMTIGLAVVVSTILQHAWASYAAAAATMVLYLVTYRMRTTPSTITVLTIGALIAIAILTTTANG